MYLEQCPNAFYGPTGELTKTTIRFMCERGITSEVFVWFGSSPDYHFPLCEEVIKFAGARVNPELDLDLLALCEFYAELRSNSPSGLLYVYSYIPGYVGATYGLMCSGNDVVLYHPNLEYSVTLDPRKGPLIYLDLGRITRTVGTTSDDAKNNFEDFRAFAALNYGDLCRTKYLRSRPAGML